MILSNFFAKGNQALSHLGHVGAEIVMGLEVLEDSLSAGASSFLELSDRLADHRSVSRVRGDLLN